MKFQVGQKVFATAEEATTYLLEYNIILEHKLTDNQASELVGLGIMYYLINECNAFYLLSNEYVVKDLGFLFSQRFTRAGNFKVPVKTKKVNEDLVPVIELYWDTFIAYQKNFNLPLTYISKEEFYSCFVYGIYLAKKKYPNNVQNLESLERQFYETVNHLNNKDKV